MRQALLTLLFLASTLSAIEIGKVLPSVELSKSEGGTVDLKAWSSDDLRHKVHVIFYVDPDEKGLNDEFNNALKEQKFDRAKYASVAIINMGATWLPNFAIASSLEAKQKEFPDTMYVKDLHKKVLKAWELADDDFNIIITDPTGKVLHVQNGKIETEQFSEIFEIIKASL